MSQAVAIALYHAVVGTPLPVADWCFLDAEILRRQLRFLKDHFEVIPLSRVAERLREKSIRHPTVAITFDDGFLNNYTVAFPLLQAEGLPATIFLTTGLIDTDDTVWFCRLNRALTNTSNRMLQWREREFDLSSRTAKANAYNMLQVLLKGLPHPQLSAELRAIIAVLGDDPDAALEGDSPFRMLSRESITEMLGSGLIELGAHTRSHAILALLSPNQQRAEIEHSLDAVARLTGQPCRLFAFPNGRPEDYDAESIRILRLLGVHTAVTSLEGHNDATTPALELRRYGIGGEWSTDEFARLTDRTPLAKPS